MAQNTVENALNRITQGINDFVKTYINKSDSNIPFSGVSSLSASNGTEKAAVGRWPIQAIFWLEWDCSSSTFGSLPIGRLTQTAADNGLAGAVFSYDPMGRIVGQWQCTPLTCGTNSVALIFGYDLLGDMTSSYNDADNVTYTNSYDTAARLTSVKSSLSDSQHPGTLITLGGFSPIQKPTGITLGNGIVEDLAYSNRGWLYSMGETPNTYGFNIYNWTNSTLGFAPNGDIVYSNDSVNGNWTYTYDDMNRLTQGVCTANCPAAQGMTYAYDRFGNRWSEAVTAGSGIQPTYYFNANNQIDISGVTYDAAGNVMNDGLGLGNTYTYDAENRIITAANGYSASYVYDAQGHRVRATVNGQTRDFIYDLSGRNIDEFTPGGSGWLGTWTRGEAYAGSLHIATYANSTTEFDNSDWLSTFRARSDVTGNRIETCTSLPFGEDLTCTGTEVTPIHFTGKERDAESGNDFFGARYYTSTMGRFLTPDWAAKPVDVPYAHFGNPQSLNLYSYVQNNPTTVGDPDGHDGGGPDASWQTDPQAKANGVEQNNHTITVVEVQGQQGNPANHVVVSVDGKAQVGFGPAKDLTKTQIAKEFTGVDQTGTPGKVEPRAEGVKTLDQVTVHVSSDQAGHAQTLINQRTSSPGNYHLTNRNCAEFGEDVLKAAGVKAPTAAVPGELMMELHIEQRLGVAPQ